MDHLFAASAEAAMVKLDLPHAMLLRRDGATGAGIGFIDAAVENCLAAFPGANALLSAENVAQAGARLTLSRLVIAQYEIGDRSKLPSRLPAGPGASQSSILRLTVTSIR